MHFLVCTVKIVGALLLLTILSGCLENPDHFLTRTSEHSTRIKTAKPGAPVKIASAPIVYMDAGKQTPVEITLETTEFSGKLEVDFLPSDGLNLIGTEMHQSLDVSTASIALPVNLLAPANGRYYLNLHIRMMNGEEYLTRAFALIVQVGEQTENTVKIKKISGENVISLPAQEKIYTK